MSNKQIAEEILREIKGKRNLLDNEIENLIKKRFPELKEYEISKIREDVKQLLIPPKENKIKPLEEDYYRGM